MGFMTKIVLSCLLSIFVTFAFDGRYMNCVTANDPEKLNVLAEQNDKPAEKSLLTGSESLEFSSDFLKESHKQEYLHPSQSVTDDPPFLDNVEVHSELTTTAEAIIFRSANTADELKNILKPQAEDKKVNNSTDIFNSFDEDKKYGIQPESKSQVQSSVDNDLNKQLNECDSTTVFNSEESKKSAPQHEDIPSFSEWSQKQLAEAEKKKTDQNDTIERFSKPRGKFRNKNYASPDCGAKIVAANPESLSSSAVLSSLKDEYMLNYCTNRIWFVVELCEAIQAKQLDLANFELFSSSPKHFSVFLSHRFPTRDWSNIGKFTAEDTRDVQTFNLHPHLFGKFVKVEMHSHYGREQFCPISWIGIYGTSEYEVIAKEDERNMLAEEDDGDPYDEEIFLGHKRDSPKNLFTSATDAVLSIVKKATAPFMKSENNETEFKNSTELVKSKDLNCISPRYIMVCNNCSQCFYDSVFHTLSCQSSTLELLLSNSFVKDSLIYGETCMKFGLDFSNLRKGAPFPYDFLKKSESGVNYLLTMLKSTFVAALCNVLAVSENKVVMNTTMEGIHSLKNLTHKKEYCEGVDPSAFPLPSTARPEISCTSDCFQSSTFDFQFTSSFELTNSVKPSEQLTNKIEPTKTLTEDEVKMLPPSNEYIESETRISDGRSTELPEKVKVTPTVALGPSKDKNEPAPTKIKDVKVVQVETKGDHQKEIPAYNKISNVTTQDAVLESIMSDISAIEKVVNSPSNTFTATSSNLPTESIFLRLVNRIKNLEINMSLSSTYLEELSRRYRTQLELLSKTVNLTIQKVEEHSKLEEEKERRREKEMIIIRMQLANLTRDMSNFMRENSRRKHGDSSISQHIFFIFIELFLIWAVFNYWKRSNKNFPDKGEPSKKISKKHKRRNSLEGVRGHEMPKRKMRRPSDEAMDIALSRAYKGDSLKIDKKRKKRKKDSKCSLNNVNLKRKVSETENPPSGEKLPDFSDEMKYQVIPFSMPVPDIDISNRFSAISSPNPPVNNIYSSVKVPNNVAPPVFMKTALAARSTRLRLNSDKESSHQIKLLQDSNKEIQKERKTSNSFKKYMKKFF